MCKFSRRDPSLRERRAYVGDTVRLDGEQALAGLEHGAERRKCFPWWTLWLLWPLLMLVKGLVVAGAATAATLAELLRQPIILEVSLLPILLIVIGLFLLLRRR